MKQKIIFISYFLLLSLLVSLFSCASFSAYKDLEEPFYNNTEYNYSIKFIDGTKYYIRPDNYHALYADLSVEDSLSSSKTPNLFFE